MLSPEDKFYEINIMVYEPQVWVRVAYFTKKISGRNKWKYICD